MFKSWSAMTFELADDLLFVGPRLMRATCADAAATYLAAMLVLRAGGMPR